VSVDLDAEADRLATEWEQLLQVTIDAVLESGKEQSCEMNVAGRRFAIATVTPDADRVTVKEDVTGTGLAWWTYPEPPFPFPL